MHLSPCQGNEQMASEQTRQGGSNRNRASEMQKGIASSRNIAPGTPPDSHRAPRLDPHHESERESERDSRPRTPPRPAAATIEGTPPKRRKKPKQPRNRTPQRRSPGQGIDEERDLLEADIEELTIDPDLTSLFALTTQEEAPLPAEIERLWEKGKLEADIGKQKSELQKLTEKAVSDGNLRTWEDGLAHLLATEDTSAIARVATASIVVWAGYDFLDGLDMSSYQMSQMLSILSKCLRETEHPLDIVQYSAQIQRRLAIKTERVGTNLRAAVVNWQAHVWAPRDITHTPTSPYVQ